MLLQVYQKHSTPPADVFLSFSPLLSSEIVITIKHPEVILKEKGFLLIALCSGKAFSLAAKSNKICCLQVVNFKIPHAKLKFPWRLIYIHLF